MSTPERLTCKDVSVLLSQSQDRPLNPAEQIRLQAHFALCRACEQVQRQMQFLRQAFRRHPGRQQEDDGETQHAGKPSDPP